MALTLSVCVKRNAFVVQTSMLPSTRAVLAMLVSWWWVHAAVDCDAVVTSRRGDVTAGRGGVQVRECADSVSSVEMCRHVLGYNVTGWPNLLGHRSLLDAVTQLRTFSPLVRHGCLGLGGGGGGGHLSWFLCAVYVPLCSEQLVPEVGPCRPVCKHVRRRCEPLLQQFGFAWPPGLDCARFPPRNNRQHMCMQGPPVHDDDHQVLAS